MTKAAKKVKGRNGALSVVAKTISSDASASGRPSVVGIDISDKCLQVCEISPNGDISEGRLASSESDLRAMFEGKEASRIIMEVGASTRWIAELLKSLGHEVLIADPRRLKLISGTLYKDDKVDARILALLAIQVPGLLKTVSLRDLKHQKALTLIRARCCAVTGRTRVINAIRGMLKPYGFRLPKCATSTFSSSLIGVVDEDILELVRPLTEVLDGFDEQISYYDKQARQLLPELAPEAVSMLEISGVGPITALYFAALIGKPDRFAKTRDVGSYLGLCRRRDDSGERKSEMRITKAGDSYMRALLVNCASYILGPLAKDCDLRTWGLKKMASGSRVDKRKAKTAVARKLAVLMLTLWKSGQSYDPFHLSKPAAKAAA